MNNEKNEFNFKNKNVIIFSVLAIVVIIIFIFMTNKNDKNQGPNFSVINDSNIQTEVTNTEVTEQVMPAGARVEVEGASPISKDNKVLALNGEEAKYTTYSGAPDAPKQTEPIAKESVPDTVLKMEIGDNGFSPNKVALKAGAPITIALTNTNEEIHIFKFDSIIMNAVTVRVFPGETRAITFNAPGEAGEYGFHCGNPTHTDERGVFIVK